MKRKQYWYCVLGVLLLASVVVTAVIIETSEARTVVMVGGSAPAAAPAGIEYVTTFLGDGDPEEQIPGCSYSAGNLVVVVYAWSGSGTISGVVDNASGTPNTFNALTKQDPGGLEYCVQIFWDVITTSGTGLTITITESGTVTNARAVALVFSGSFPADPRDVNTGAWGDSGSLSVVSGVLDQAVEALVVGYYGEYAMTEDAAWTEVGYYTSPYISVQYKIVSATSSVTNTTTASSGYWTGAMGSFKNQ